MIRRQHGRGRIQHNEPELNFIWNEQLNEVRVQVRGGQGYHLMNYEEAKVLYQCLEYLFGPIVNNP